MAKFVKIHKQCDGHGCLGCFGKGYVEHEACPACLGSGVHRAKDPIGVDEKKKLMTCCDCFARIRASVAQAKKHEWEVWVGGAMCKSCCERRGGKNP